MSNERDNFIIDRPESRPADRQAAQSECRDADLYAEFLEHREEFEAWLGQEPRLLPANDEEERAYSCTGWHIYSPRWNAEEALANSNTRSWEAIVIVSKVQSAAWVKARFKGCSCVPLRVNDRRLAEKNLAAHRRRKREVRGKKSFVPSASDLGCAGGDEQ